MQTHMRHPILFCYLKWECCKWSDCYPNYETHLHRPLLFSSSRRIVGMILLAMSAVGKDLK
jgi:hypothetical protein